MENSNRGFDKLLEEVELSIPFYTLHLKNLRVLKAQQDRAIKYLEENIDEPQLDVLKELDKLNSFQALLTISLLDLLVVCKNMCLSKYDWESAFFIKQCSLIIYETCKNYKVQQRPLRSLVIEKYPSFLNKFNELNRNIYLFMEEPDYAYIKDIRNKIAGHIEKDFSIYYDTIFNLDGEKTGKIISKFLKIVGDFQKYLVEIIKCANSNSNQEKEQLDGKLKEIKMKIDKLLEIYSN